MRKTLALPLLLLLTTACTMHRDEQTPLVSAARAGDAAQVRALLARGADPNEPSGENGWTPLLHAVHKGQREAAAALLDGGAAIDRGSPSGMTPLMMAAGYDDRDMVALLLRRGASLRATDAHGEAAVDYAMSGMIDLDRFTYFRCNAAATSLLRSDLANAKRGSVRWAHLKGCV
ncbi:MAG TPA: ankyrin repeat domain-containing protein [Thermoanaerobaculia bacterium]|jgi:ankyrin repeat protein